MTRLRNLFLGLVLVIALLIGGWWMLHRMFRNHTQTDADVLLEQYRDVAKLVTNEGEFLEIYEYRDYWGVDIAPLRKKALIRAKARAMVGFDLEAIAIEIRDVDRMIILSDLPEPEILALEIHLDYYDLDAGTFNAFGPGDINRMESDIRNDIRKKVLESDLFRQSGERANLFFKTMKALSSRTGWELRYRDHLHLKALP